MSQSHSKLKGFTLYFLSALVIGLTASAVIVKAEQEEQENYYMLLSRFSIEPEEIKAKPKEEQPKQEEPTELDARQKKVAAYNVLSQGGKLEHTTNVIKPYAWQEWNIINTPMFGPDLLHAIDKTQTIFGHVMLARLLSEPKVNLELIEKRRNFIKLLIQDHKLFEKIERILETIKEKEGLFLSLGTPTGSWNKPDEQDRSLIFKFFERIAQTYENPAVAQATRINFLTTFAGVMPTTAILITGLGALITQDISREIRQRPIGTLFSLGSLWTGITVLNGVCGVGSYFVTKQLNKDDYAAYKKMQSASALFQAAHELVNAFANKSQIAGFSLYRNLKKSVYQAESFSPRFKKLQDLLEPNFYKKEAKWYSNLGKALSAHSMINEVKHNFAQMLEAIGQLDAYMSVARMIKEHNNTEHKYSFVEFVNDKTPVIDLVQSWNPLLGTEGKCDDIAFGQAYGVANAMLTGPHGGGKSTSMKTIAYSIILGQVFGIAPAARVTMTLTHKLLLYANVKEDLSKGQSTFMAEKARVDEISADLASLKADELSVTLVDEAFKGTMSAEGSYRLSKFVQQIAPISSNLAVIATHYKKPARLEDELPGLITNYHVGLEELPDGSFIRTFKLIKGRNEWWFNDSAKRIRYIDWLTSLDQKQTQISS